MSDLPHRAKRLTYRPDIDGLRAVAVLLVLFDHLHTRITGGYIGVDVFFVISGYLISSVILSEMASGTFSVATFYERRIRRIFPALLATLAGTTVLAYLYLIPYELEAYARSLLAALLSVSNLLFWHQAGYFDAPSSLKPLLHTWSLAVEEQFYIFFPLLLIFIRRVLPGRLKLTIWTVFAVSFVLACIIARRDPAAAFFFAPLRAWELLIGTVLSQDYLPDIQGAVKRNLATVAGLFLIVIPAFRYNDHTVFPGLTALPACLGAALIIAGGATGSSLVGRCLAWRPVVFVGLISYSLYLWHWPILVFQNTSFMLVAAPRGSKSVKVVVFLVSMLVATLSWRFIEQPFRKGRFRPARRTLFLSSGVAVALIALLAGALVVARGFPARFPAEALAVARYTDYDPTVAFRENVCFISPHSHLSDFNHATCLQTHPTRHQILLLGDSHAAHLYPGLVAAFPQDDISQANTASCRPFLQQPPGTGPDCTGMWKFIYQDYLPQHHFDAVLIAGRWDPTDFAELGRTLQPLQQRGVPVILVGPVPEYDVPLPRLLALSLRNHDPALLARHVTPEPPETDRQLATLARDQWHVRYISVFDDVCNPTVQVPLPAPAPNCPIYAAPGVPLLFDTDHLTPEGSLLLARAIEARHQLP